MSTFTADDHRFMARAIQLAERGRYTTDPNPRVGCVIVRNGEIIGEGWHVAAGEPHAEVHALRQAGERAQGATAYVTLEPCSHHGRTPPCAQALVMARVARVVVAIKDPFPRVASRGMAQLQAAGIEVACGLMGEQAEALNPGFLRRQRQGRPYVRCKIAMSLDGRTAMASGESKWITSPQARQDVQRLRARSSAIVTGIGTVLADDPQMNVRLDEAVKQPVRVVLDSQLRFPLTAKMLTDGGAVWIATEKGHSGQQERLRLAGAEIIDLPPRRGSMAGLDLDALLVALADKSINEVLVEAGPTLSGAMVAAGLVDELVIYMAPHLMGSEARGLLHLPGLTTMAQRIALDIRDIRSVGPDIRLTARLQPT